jgi:hypothetical protein
MMLSVPFTNQIIESTKTTCDVLATYRDLINSFPASMYQLEMNNSWTKDVIYRMSDGQVQVDYHPTPMNYYNYLTKLGFALNEDSKLYALESDKTYRTVESIEQLQELFYGEYEFSTTKNMW